MERLLNTVLTKYLIDNLGDVMTFLAFSKTHHGEFWDCSEFLMLSHTRYTSYYWD